MASITRAEALLTTMRISITSGSAIKTTRSKSRRCSFGIDGKEEPRYLMTRDGNGYVVLGQTPDGRFLKLYGEYVVSEPDGQSLLRPVGCIDMTPNDRRRSKEHLK